MINGKSYDWEDMSIMMPNGVSGGIKEIKYTDEQPITAHYGKGAIPRGYGRGNYAGSGSFALYRDEWEALVPTLAKNGGIYDHDPFTIVVSYANNDKPEVVDTLKSVKITKFDGGGGAQGDDEVSTMTCEFVILEPILWNGVPAKKSDSIIQV